MAQSGQAHQLRFTERTFCKSWFEAKIGRPEAALFVPRACLFRNGLVNVIGDVYVTMSRSFHVSTFLSKPRRHRILCTYTVIDCFVMTLSDNLASEDIPLGG